MFIFVLLVHLVLQVIAEGIKKTIFVIYEFFN